jgi:succinate dehydrogenase / fumarate reductase membrane anchor subunit
MIDKATIADPKTHYGSAHGATRHFMTQRITGALNVLFTIFFVWFVLRLAGADRADMVGVVRNPLVAIVLALLIVNVSIHMRIGMAEVIEDYIDEAKAHRLALAANTWFAVAVAVLSLVAIAKIVFWG